MELLSKSITYNRKRLQRYKLMSIYLNDAYNSFNILKKMFDVDNRRSYSSKPMEVAVHSNDSMNGREFKNSTFRLNNGPLKKLEESLQAIK